MWSQIRLPFLLLAICAALPRPAAAQDTHADVLGGMVEDCLGPAVADADTFRVAFEGVPGFMETRLIAHWLDEGRVVLAGEASGEDDAADLHLHAAIDEAGVVLDRAGGGMLERTARIVVTYRLTASTDRVLAADTCRSSEQDVIDGDLAESLADGRYSGTSPEIPSTSRLRRFVEPVVVIGAAAIGTYLFFNLRSSRSDN